MSNQKYNGWSNKATWNISLVYEDHFRDMAESQADQFDDVCDVADAFKSIVEELELEPLEKITGMAYELVSDVLNQVNWMELAEHFGEEQIVKQLEQEKQEKQSVTTYRQSFSTEAEASAFCKQLILGGVIQQQENIWHVWQIN